MSTQKERRSNGIDLLRTLGGGEYDPERAATAMVRRHGALGSFAVDHVLGNLWSRPQLSRRDRSLIVVTFLATIGSIDELRSHVRGALNHDLSRSEIEEVVLQVAGYAGFPMAMQAARIVDEVFCAVDGVDRQPERGEAAAKDDAERHADATDVLGTLFAGRTSSDPATARASIVDALGGVGELAFDWGFGELWARPQLSRRDRSLVTVAILAILARAEELAVHVPGALNHGVSREEVEEVMVQLTVYGGFPRAVEGMRSARAAFERISA
ncbi:MAG: carboxymuconolactone decarboxylase family protein [Pseudomonadales bacterium]